MVNLSVASGVLPIPPIVFFRVLEKCSCSLEGVFWFCWLREVNLAVPTKKTPAWAAVSPEQEERYKKITKEEVGQLTGMERERAR